MSDTVRLRATITWEYDADPAHYPSPDPTAMAALDQEGVSEDPIVFLMDDRIDPQITVEPVERAETPCP